MAAEQEKPHLLQNQLQNLVQVPLNQLPMVSAGNVPTNTQTSITGKNKPSSDSSKKKLPKTEDVSNCIFLILGISVILFSAGSYVFHKN